MISITRDLIEYYGIDDCLPLDPKNFKQINVEDEACVPIQKPDIEQIVKVYASAEIKSSKVIKTPKGTSLEGVRLTGYKLIVEGEISYKIQYVADTATQSVHTFHYKTPFMSFVVLPEDFSETSYLTVSAFIEDIYSHQIDCRCTYLNTTLLIIAESC